MKCVYQLGYKAMFVSVRDFQNIVLDLNDIHRMPFQIKSPHVSNNILNFNRIFYICSCFIVYVNLTFKIRLIITTVK